MIAKERQVELQVKLTPGRYIVLPRTTGGLMVNKPKDLVAQAPTSLLNASGELSSAMSGVVEDIFRKFDLFIGRELNYQEFKILYQMVDQTREITQSEFESKFLKQYCCTSEGITVRGLKDFMRDSVQKLGEDTVRAWLSNLGYDKHLFNAESRAFTLTFHCTEKFKVEAKDAIRTELDIWANAAIATREFETQGPQKDFISRNGIYRVFYSFSE